MEQQNRTARFWQKVDKSKVCWEWRAAKTSKGYGKFASGDGRWTLAHRLSYELLIGPIPTGMCVLHRCDNARCVNPNHLFLGTLADNVIDCVSKDRHAAGERHPLAKLTRQQVNEIRDRYSYERPYQRLIAVEYGVSVSQICKILKGNSWR